MTEEKGRYEVGEQNCITETLKHRLAVREIMHAITGELQTRAHIHDQSKLEPPELEVFAEFTPKLKNSTYGSDEYKGFLEAMGPALRHHYQHNRHHPEFYPDGINGMTLIDLIEMLCDWIAATKRHANGDIYRSIDINQRRFYYGPEICQLLVNTVNALVELGIVEYSGEGDGP